MASVRDFFKRMVSSVGRFMKGASGSVVETTRGAFSSVVDVARAALGSAVDVTKEAVTTYVAFLRSLAIWSLLAVVILLPLPILGTVFRWSWMNGLFLLGLALIFSTLLMAASPLVILARLGCEHVKPFKWMAQLRAGFWFWSLLIVAYFWLVPVWNYPTAIPLIIVICIFLAVAFVRFGYSLNPKLFFRLMLGLLLVITIFCYMPASRAAAGTFVAWLDSSLAGLLASPSHSAPKRPQRIPYDLASINSITLFDPTTGDSMVWYCESQDAGIELFDGPGYHPQYKGELKPITPEVVTKIMNQLKANAQQRMTQEEQMRARPQPPRRIPYDYVSIGKIVFFDPTTSEPRVWYYTLEGGMIELFDGPGYHPQYKGELKATTPEIVARIMTQLKADVQQRMTQEEQMRALPHPPKRIPCDYSSVGTIVFFDPTTSAPRVWYYVPEDGMIELFDGPGYHPQYKGELKPITPDIVTQIRKQVKAEAEKAAQDAQRRREEFEKTSHRQGTSPSDGKDANRSKTSRVAKPPVIKAEDADGQVEKQKDGVGGWRERVIEPEDSNGVVLGPKSR